MSDAQPSDAGEYSCSDGPTGDRITHVLVFGGMPSFRVERKTLVTLLPKKRVSIPILFKITFF